MKTSWEAIEGDMRHYVDIHAREVVIGASGRSAYSDNATSVTLAEFLAGAYQDEVLRHFDRAALDEMLAAARAGGG